ncbi:hypothetical protein DSM107133_02389 [Pseudosulfitobacter sp. DSM 107133]|nr:hypothetical protein DSM107133_00495 [Pseudosulfitobacter sp. DSM 107133]UOA27659.1 hypothetical protein DSM107133_02389 [Pseudosulfitobacter sp. DSM 107133]
MSKTCLRHDARRPAALSQTFRGSSAKVEPVPATFWIAGTGDGWIVCGQVFEDRNQVRSPVVFA